MAISVQRLTLFAIFDAMERDLRAILENNILPFINIETMLFDDELSKIKDRCRKIESSEDVDLAEGGTLIHYLDMMDTVKCLYSGPMSLRPRCS